MTSTRPRSLVTGTPASSTRAQQSLELSLYGFQGISARNLPAKGSAPCYNGAASFKEIGIDACPS